jgi:hypothetical protein
MGDEKPLAGEQFYGIIAFIPDDADFTLEAGVVRLSQAFPRRQVYRNQKEITVAAKKWRIWLDYVDELYVARESQEMASWIAGHPDAITPARMIFTNSWPLHIGPKDAGNS